jgi:hypothetical protein
MLVRRIHKVALELVAGRSDGTIRIILDTDESPGTKQRLPQL